MAAGDWKEMLMAAENGNLELVRYHIRMGENPNFQHPEFLTTPLIEAATFGHLDIVKFLLENCAEPSIKSDSTSDTALKIAKLNGHKEIADLLTSYGSVT